MVKFTFTLTNKNNQFFKLNFIYFGIYVFLKIIYCWWYPIGIPNECTLINTIFL